MKISHCCTPKWTVLAVALVGFLAACDRDAGESVPPSVQDFVTQEPAPMPADTNPATPPKADAQMQAMLDQLATLGGKPI